MSCAQTTSQPNGAALAAGVGATLGAQRAQVQAQLAPACPTPTQWTSAQKAAVSTTIQAHATEPGMGILAPEWQRLNKGARTCRGLP